MTIHLCYSSLTRIKQERIRATQNNHTGLVIDKNTNHSGFQNTSSLNVTQTMENQLESSLNNVMTTEFCLYVQATLLMLVFFLGIAR